MNIQSGLLWLGLAIATIGGWFGIVGLLGHLLVGELKEGKDQGFECFCCLLVATVVVAAFWVGAIWG